MIPDVQEMPGEDHRRNEMSGESHHSVSYPMGVAGRNEMSGESAPHHLNY